MNHAFPERGIVVEILEEKFTLLPENAVFWHKEEALLFSDVHLGKAEVFQRQGIPVPIGSDEENIARLESLCENFDVKRLYCLGDFIHSKLFWSSSLSKRVSTFMNHWGPNFTLIAGNHEMGTAKNFAVFGTRVEESEMMVRHFLLSHGDERTSGAGSRPQPFTISGHVHPVVRVGSQSDAFTARCFYLTESMLLLPAFGEFTGGFKIKPRSDGRVFAVLPDSVIEI